MEIQRAYKTELKLNNKQTTALLKHAGSARFAFNWGLNRIKEKTSKPNAMELHKELNSRKKNEFPWMYEVSKCSMQESLRDVQKAFQNFFRGMKKDRDLNVAINLRNFNTVSSTEIGEMISQNGQGDAKVHEETQVGVDEMTIKQGVCGVSSLFST